MNSKDLKEKYLSFFERNGHKRIESSSLVPDNDPSVLFTTAGMHPLVPFLMGEPHPLGNRITDVQKCIRTGDIDEVGDETHFTFFEMLGNWSFGDYFKEDAIKLSFEFLTSELNIPVSRLAVTCFAGDSDAPKDEESANIWKGLGINEKRIAFLSKKDNWWGPAGETGPCGPDSEMFYWVKDNNPPEIFDPEDSNWVEIWNDVFMQYNKQKDGSYIPLKQRNVDTGLGVERVSMVLQGKKNAYEIESIKPIYDKVKSIVNIHDPNELQIKSLRIITDHMRASTFILADERGVVPSNVDQGYILRRFIRRSIRHFYLLGASDNITDSILDVSKKVIDQFGDQYPELKTRQDFILDEFKKESDKFVTTIGRGLKEIEKKMKGYMLQEKGNDLPPEKRNNDSINLIMLDWKKETKELKLDSKWLFDLFQSFGMPIEMSLEEVKDSYNVKVLGEEKLISMFNKLFKEHQELSRQGAEKRFKGGLADHSDMSKKLHTATHLLNEALRKVLSSDIRQKGSNITSERLRFDFNFSRKLTDEEKKQVEDLVNEQIKKELPITKVQMPLKDALNSGAQSEFAVKYPDIVWVYTVGDFSKEICTGPHVDNTKELGRFKIKKEESTAAGIRRIKAVLE